MPWTYILRCADNSYYTVSCVDLDLRMAQHWTGKGSKFTGKRLPVELVFAAEFERVADAYAFEKQIQGWSRAKKEAIIASNFDKLPELSKKDYSKYEGPLATRRFD
ncbi:MAG TPA: GIY-YIG nuclease family protein [Galbitalea sp.]|jgi:predicted GIY-YIG superfamily endonuclease|nr:GIY-YIG nuclease family protein [Galbitalea sp.]